MARYARGEKVKARLLEAAGTLFAEKGYRSASIREICERAKTNIAAVNYYFRSKQGLYDAALAHAFNCVLERAPADTEGEDSATPEDRLHAFIRSYLLQRICRKGLKWQIKLLASVLATPGSIRRPFVKQAIRRNYKDLARVVKDIIGPKADQECFELCMISVVGQCLVYQYARDVILSECRHVRMTPEGIERLAEHITRFSLAALKAEARAPQGRKRRGR